MSTGDFNVFWRTARPFYSTLVTQVAIKVHACLVSLHSPSFPGQPWGHWRMHVNHSLLAQFPVAQVSSLAHASP